MYLPKPPPGAALSAPDLESLLTARLRLGYPGMGWAGRRWEASSLSLVVSESSLAGPRLPTPEADLWWLGLAWFCPSAPV